MNAYRSLGRATPSLLHSYRSYISAKPASPLISRSMASATSGKPKVEWLVWLPDHQGALGRRMEVRPKHLEGATSMCSSGGITMGGATVDEHPKPGEAPKINGSVIVYQAESREEVEKIVKNDIYATSGVWDISKIQIYPFVTAVRSAL